MRTMRFPFLHCLAFLAIACIMSPAMAQEEGKKEEAQQEEKKEEAKPEQKKEEAKPEEKKEEPKKEEPAEVEKPELGADAEEGTKGMVVLEGLNNPCGVAIQPETNTVFVADSGNHKIVKLVDGKAQDVITDFPKDVYGKGPKVNIGPLGMVFLDKDTLVVGGGGQPDGEELLRVYKIEDKAIKADKMAASFSLAATDEIKGEGNFYALAASSTGVYVTCNGDDTKGWVSRATVKDGKVEGYERYLATKEATEVDAPVGIAFSPEGYLVVGQMGEINVPGDSLLTFYDAETKEMLLNLETGLHDISAVGYSPRGQMYVLDYAWADASQGGLYQILEDNSSDSGMKTKKIMSLDKPTAMVFNGDGDLYITVIGEAADANSKGQLIKVTKEAGL